MPELERVAERDDRKTGGHAAPDNAALLRLIKRAQKGDRAALYDLCAQSMRIVYFLAMRLVGNPADAEDVMQESLLRMCGKIRELRDPEAFVSWLSRITTNEARALYKRNAKHGVVLNIDDYLEGVTESSRDFLPEEYAESEENREAIIAIIDTLPMRQREAVVLCYYGGLSVTEAAAEMGIEKANVSQYLKLARAKLRAEMESRDLAPADRQVKLRAVGIPAGLLLFRRLSREAELLPLDHTVAQQALAKCGSAIQTGAVSAIGLLAGSKLLLAPVAVATGAAVAVGAAAVVATTVSKPAPPPEPSAQTRMAMESEIGFSGGEDRGEGKAWLNPAGARPDTAGGALLVTEWWVTPAEDDRVLYSGTGSDGVEAALAELKEQSGVYIVNFRLKDDAGFVFRKSRNFRVDGG